MVTGLLSELEDRNCWTVAEAAGHRARTGCSTLSRARVDDQGILDSTAVWAAGCLAGDEAGKESVLIID